MKKEKLVLSLSGRHVEIWVLNLSFLWATSLNGNATEAAMAKRAVVVATFLSLRIVNSWRVKIDTQVPYV